MGGALTYRLGVFATSEEEEVDDLADLFANGETGDWWRLDTANTVRNGLGHVQEAVGKVNGLSLESFGVDPVSITTVGGLECGDFPGSSDCMRINFGTSVPQPGTIIICLRDNDTTTHVIVSGISAAVRWQISNDSTDDIVMFAPSTEFDTTINSPIGTKVLTAEFNGASSKFRRNGTQVSTGNPGSGSTDQLTIGALYDGNFSGDMEIFSVLFISRLLTSEERDRAERLLGSHAGLSW